MTLLNIIQTWHDVSHQHRERTRPNTRNMNSFIHNTLNREYTRHLRHPLVKISMKVKPLLKEWSVYTFNHGTIIISYRPIISDSVLQ